MSSEHECATPGVESILERLQRLKDARLAPYEMVEAAVLLHQHLGADEAAARLGVSVQHLGNLVRLRRQLVPVAWDKFRELSWSARLKNWIKIAALSVPGQVEASALERAASSVNPMGDLEPDDYQGVPAGTRLVADGP
jgi:hypothetical protein